MIDDEILMAYVDGELDAETRRRVDAEAAEDPETARRLIRHAELRARMSKAFADVLEEPAPAWLRDLAAGAPSARVIDLAAARAARRPAVAGAWRAASGMAACLVLGLAVGAGLDRLGPASPIGAAGGEMVARGVLANALDHQLASAQTRAAPVRIGVSFRTASGDYCRTFQAPAMAGLACREGRAWSVKAAVAHASGGHSAGEFATAASDTPPAVTEMAESLIQGAPLDARAEAAAAARGWRRGP